MKLFQKAALWGASKMAGYAGVSLTAMDSQLGKFFGTGSTVTGRAVTDDSAMQITTVFACIRLIAEQVGAVTLDVYETQKNGNAQKVVDHDLTEILVNRPNADMTGLEFREALTTNLAGRGNAFALIDHTAQNVSSLYPVQSSKVQPKRADDGTITYKINDRGRWETYPAEKIWHIRGFGYTGLEGLSPIGCAREAMGLALAGEEFNARLFAQGLTPSALISIPQWLKPDQRVEANKKLLEMHAGLTNMGKPILLEGGMTVQPGFITPEDAQFLQLRRFQIPEICRLFRISPHMVADLERATNNNIEQLSLEFVMYTMLPYFRRFEERARQLFKPAERRRFFVRFNFESLLRADSTARAQLYSILLQNGVFSRNEVRALEKRNRVDDAGMDDYTVQSNMALVNLLDMMNRAQSGAAPGAKP